MALPQLVGLIVTFSCISELEASFLVLERCLSRLWDAELSGGHPCKPNNNVNFNLTCVETDTGGRCLVLDPVSFKYRVEAWYVPRQPTRDVENLWVSGKGPGFSGSNLIEMRSGGVAGIWTTDIEFTVDVQCSTLSTCPVGPFWDLQLTIYKGANVREDRMLGPSYQYHLPMSGMVSGSRLFQPPSLTVDPWFHGSRVAMRDHVIQLSRTMADSLGIPTDDQESEIDYTMAVMYPPSFEDNQKKNYRLVLVLGMDVVRLLPATFEHMLLEESSVEEAVLVGLSYPAGLDCMLLPQVSKEYECKGGLCGVDCQTCKEPSRNASTACSKEEYQYEQEKCGRVRWCGGKADVFTDFIIDTIIPSLKELLQDRVSVHPKSSPLTIMGYRHGGLFACYAAMKHPELFKNAACISPSFYAPLVEKFEYSFLDTMKEEVQRYTDNRTDPRILQHFDQTFYLEVGQHDHVHFPLYQANDVVHEAVKLFGSIGFEMNKNLFFTEIKGFSSYDFSNSEEVSFYLRIVRPLQLFLRPGGNPNVANMVSPATTTSIGSEELPQWSILASPPDQTQRPVIEPVATTDDYTVRNILGSKDHYSSCEKKHITVTILAGTLVVAVLLSVVLTVLCVCLVENTLVWSGKKNKDEDYDSEEDASSHGDGDDDDADSYDTYDDSDEKD